MRSLFKLAIFPLLVIASLSICSMPALGFSHEEIFKWVAAELGIKKEYPMPEILIVSKKTLQHTFTENNKKSLRLWTGMFGEKEATQMMNRYLEEVLGLFDPQTEIVYVGDFMQPCKEESIIAHELAHYFQVKEQGKVYSHYHNADLLKFRNEMEAYEIEEKFKQSFCGFIEITQ